MRVLFITNLFPPGYTGGAEISNYYVCQGLIRRGATCSILSVHNRMPRTADTWYDYDGLPVHRVDFFTRVREALTDVFDGRVYQAVRREIQRFKPDIVHIGNVSGSTLAPFAACQSLHVPVVNILHDLWLLCANNMLYRADGTTCNPAAKRSRCQHCYRRYDYWGNIPYRRAVFKALTGNVRVFISPSQAMIDRHVEAGYDLRRFRHVPHAMPDPFPVTVTQPRLAEAIQLSHQHPTIAYAGGGIEIKGARVLLAALPALQQAIPNLRVLIAGTGEEALQAEFRKFAPTTELLGWVSFKEIYALFNAVDLVAVPSTWHEAFSLVTLESLQSGTPVVGTALGGIPELVQEGETGYLLPPGDAMALVDRVTRHFAQSPQRRRQMRQHCRQYVSTHLTYERQLDGVQAVYHEVLTL